MNWVDIIKLDIVKNSLLVLAAGFVSLCAALIAQWYANYRRRRERQREIGGAIVHDVYNHFVRLTNLVRVSSYKGPKAVDLFRVKVSKLSPFDRIIYLSIAREISKLPEEIFVKVFGLYSSLDAFDAKVKGTNTVEEQKDVIAALEDEIRDIIKKGCEAGAMIQEKILKNKKEAKLLRELSLEKELDRLKEEGKTGAEKGCKDSQKET